MNKVQRRLEKSHIMGEQDIDALITPLNMTGPYIERVSKGDIPRRLPMNTKVI